MRSKMGENGDVNGRGGRGESVHEIRGSDMKVRINFGC